MPPRPKLEKYRQLVFHSTADVVLLARLGRIIYKTARISFGRDGSIYVQFPYCNEKEGWIGELKIPPDQAQPVTYSLRQNGRFVDTDVKFSHHRSGIALFSKSGHELPQMRRQSFPLNGPIGICSTSKYSARLNSNRLESLIRKSNTSL